MQNAASMSDLLLTVKVMIREPPNEDKKLARRAVAWAEGRDGHVRSRKASAFETLNVY